LTDHPNFIHDGKLDAQGVAAELRRYLDLILRTTRVVLEYQITVYPRAASAKSDDEFETPEVLVIFRGRDQERLLEQNAELLLSLEYIALRWLHLDPHYYDRVRFDCGEYRAMRQEELKLSARVAAQRVRETRQPFRFNAMSPRERRVIHLVLKTQPGVRTASEGAGDDRQVVVFPADSK
jgi:spoIIIJ-associated protein